MRAYMTQEYLKNLIESVASASVLPNSNLTAGMPLTGKIKSLKNFVYIIKCSNNDDGFIVENGTQIHQDDATKHKVPQAKIKSVKAKRYP